MHRNRPSTTILTKDKLFTLCHMEYVEDFAAIAHRAEEQIAYAKGHPTGRNLPGRDDWLFMTAIPWVSFTSFMHPMPLHPADSVPRLAWGKAFQDAGSIMMPLSVKGHHALMDGLHVGMFFEFVEESFRELRRVLGV